MHLLSVRQKAQFTPLVKHDAQVENVEHAGGAGQNDGLERKFLHDPAIVRQVALSRQNTHPSLVQALQFEYELHGAGAPHRSIVNTVEEEEVCFPAMFRNKSVVLTVKFVGNNWDLGSTIAFAKLPFPSNDS